MSKRNNVLVWIVAIIVIVGAVYTIITNKTSQNDKQETIKIGVIVPLSGDAAFYGEPARNIYQMAVNEINASGGINGKKINLIVEDGKCSGKDGANAASKLITVDKVKIIIGGFCSSESLSAVPIALENKVFMISAGSSSPALTGISDYFVRNYPSDATQGSTLAQLAYTNKQWKKIAFIQEQTDYALGIYNAFNNKFSELGGTVVKEEFPSTVTDFKTILTKLRNENPDALFVVPQTPAAADRIFKQMADLGWKPSLIVSDAVSGANEMVQRNKSALEGAFAAEFGVDPTNSIFKNFINEYQKQFGKEMPYQSYGQTEYDAVYMIRDAIKAVGTDTSKIAAWFRSVKDWKGASGLVEIGADGDRIGGHVVKIIRNGIPEIYK